jgi:chromosome segregation ATPase
MANKNSDKSGTARDENYAETRGTESDLEDTSKLRIDAAALSRHVTEPMADCVDEFEDTGEFPMLTVENASEPAKQTTPLQATADERASYLLHHLEGEIQQLQAKWEFVADMLRVRETRIDELLREAHAKDATTEELRREIAEHAAGKQALQAELEQAAARIAELVATQSAGDAKRTERQQELEQARVKAVDLEAKVAGLSATIEDLRAAVDCGRSNAAAAAQTHEAQVAANNELRVTIQELESYIDSRKSSWSALQAKVTEYEAALAVFERSDTDKDLQLVEHGKERERLAARVQDLERVCKELEARCNTRELEHADIQEQLSAQTAAATQLRAELAEVSSAATETAERLARRDKFVETLQDDLVAHDETIAGFTESLEKQRRAEAELRAHRDTLAERVAELETMAAERQTRVDGLQASNTAAEQALRKAEQRVETLEHESHARAKEIADLRGALGTQEELIGRLRSDLRAKQRALDLLERNVKKLNDLGASVAGLDRKFSSASTEIVGTNLRPMRSRESSAPAVEIGFAPGSAASNRRMLVAVDGEERTRYLLHKADMTVGRSVESDIRIRSPFISRVHARIFARAADTLIEDLGSKNGVLVNMAPVHEPTALKDGDVINLGGSLNLMYVELDRPAPSGQPDTPSKTIPLSAVR